MASVDERVVSMKFDNKQFLDGTSSTISALGKLKESLNLKGAAKGLDEVDSKQKGIKFGSMQEALQGLAQKFDALRLVAINVLSNIATKATMAAGQFLKAWTIQPVIDGFHEYETQLNAVQTILANTKSKGSTIQDVNSALNELNHYADKTIYNFTEMTRNIGTFTAAGVGLKESVSSIQGIANLAAISGSNSQQASTAMYQLSQALATGTVKLMDWNSVVNAGMGGQVFQDALIRTSEHLGTGAKKAIKAKKSFRESLSTGWLTSKVLNETLAQFALSVDTAEDYDKAVKDLVKQGYTQQQAKDIADMAKTAGDAATKVKTFTQLIDTLKEALGSGWTQTWQYLFGDFEEAREMWTKVSDVLSKMINDSSDARNAIVKSFIDMGGRKDIIDSVSNAFKTLTSIMSTVKSAWSSVFPPITAKTLKNMTEGIKNFTEAMKPSKETLDNLKRTLAGIFAVFHIVWTVVKSLAKGFFELVGAIAPAAGGFLKITGSVGDFLVSVDKAVSSSKVLDTVISAIVRTVRGAVDIFKNLSNALWDVAKGAFKINTSIFTAFGNKLKHDANEVGKGVNVFKVFFGALVGIVKAVVPALSKLAVAVSDKLGKIASHIRNATKNFDAEKFLGMVNKVLVGGVLLGIRKFLKGITTEVGGSNPLKALTELLGTAKSSLQDFMKGFKVKQLMQIAGSIALLSVSLYGLSTLDPKNLASGIAGITVLFTEMMGAMKLFTLIANDKDVAGINKLAAALILLGVALNLLAFAVRTLAKLDYQQLNNGLFAVLVLLGSLVGSMALMAKVMDSVTSNKTSLDGLVKMSASLILVAVAINLLASAVKTLAKIEWTELIKGLGAVITLLAALAGYQYLLSKIDGLKKTGLEMLVLAAAIRVLAEAVKVFASMDWEGLAKGFASISAILLALAGFEFIVSKIKGFHKVAGQILVLSAAMTVMSAAFKIFASMSWDDLGKGLVAVTSSLASMALLFLAMPEKKLLSSAAAISSLAGAIIIIAGAFKVVSTIDWEGIAKGMIALNGTMLLMALISDLAENGLKGAAAIAIMSGSLVTLSGALFLLGRMSWESIIKGMVAMAGAFTIMGVAALVLKPLVLTIIALSAAIALFGVGVAAFGAGLILISTGLSALAAAAPVAGAGLTSLLLILINLIPAALKAVGEGIVEMINAVVQTLADSVGTISQAVIEIITGILDVVIQLTPKIVETVKTILLQLCQLIIDTAPNIVGAAMALVTNFLKGLADNFPSIINSGFRMMLAFLSGVEQNIGKIVNKAVAIVVNFVDAIARNLGKIVESGVNLVIQFIEAVGHACENNGERIGHAAYTLAKGLVLGLAKGIWAFAGDLWRDLSSFFGGVMNRISDQMHPLTSRMESIGNNMILGLINGIKGRSIRAENAVANVATKLADVTAKRNKIHSPSRLYYGFGEYMMMGLTLGIKENGWRSVDAITKVSNAVTDAYNSIGNRGTLSDYTPKILDNLDLRPKIRPVMDLSAVEEGANRISAMLDTGVGYNAAVGLDYGREAAARAALDASAPREVARNNNITYVQNNYSPKSIDAVDIYRQTRNQLSSVEEAINRS